MDTKKLRQKILDLAIRGKLVPQDPNDEPASVLLERIRAEKERLIKEGKIKRSKKSASDTPHYEKVPFEVPEGWGWCKLIDVCHIFGRIGFRGYTKDDLVSDDGAITLSPSNIIDGQMNYDNCTYISWNKYEESPEIQIANGDILLVKTGSSFGKCAYVCNLPQKATINPQFVVLKHILCNPRFLTYILQSGYARRNYDEFVLGTAIPTFTQVVLGDMYIPLPSLQEQQRIVNVIGQWFKLIDDLEKEQNGLQRILQQTKSKILELAIHGKLVPQEPTDEPAINLLKRINPKFTPCDNAHYPFDVPHNWVWAKGLDIFKPMKATSPLGDTFKYIDIDAIDNKRNVVTSVKVLNTKQAPSRASRYTEKGCVLFSMVRPYLRNIAMVTENDCIASTGFFVCQGNGCLLPKFCYFQMLSNYVVDGLNDFMKGDNSPSITKAQIEEYIFPLPPLNEQKRIVTKIEELFAVLDEIQKSIEA